MTAVKHPFECLEIKRYRRFKTETLVEASNYKVTRFCQCVVKPPCQPKSPYPQNPIPHTIPSQCRWFDFKKIHSIERSAFPELSDPIFARNYKRIRNKFIKLFRLYPTTDVTTSTMRHMEGGDALLISRIHHFLCVWGLINFTPNFATQSQPSPTYSNLRNEYALAVENIHFNTPATSHPLPHLEVKCALCKDSCGQGHFISKKYPGIVICLMCFSHQNTLSQLEVNRADFEFRTLPQRINEPTPTNEFIENKIFQNFNTFKGDWTKLGENIEGKSPLECFIIFLRDHISDFANAPNLQSHEFNDSEPLSELLAFANGENEVAENEGLHYNDDWNGLKGEIDLLEDEVKSALGL
ncbi:SWI/SNF complex subunit SWI3B [Histomonas meleagridis]|uniref:SWI/SNF complex subunit SWI3B n=1 Tax=Histomonas meleagridis TaxID=135588 RepID=UPI0035598C61|nr:SWI/SNF complex subunit SWI3B [Histomonas meleagridis]KAH0801874.1 SWI/SNF complex subunit SWI3B [Histomonas meleagridis]